MIKFNHPNVMRLLGVTISQSKSLLLIMPFMAQGSLLHYLRNHRADLTVENEEMDEMVRVSQYVFLGYNEQGVSFSCHCGKESLN